MKGAKQWSCSSSVNATMAIIDHLSEPAHQGDKWPCEGLGAWGWLSCDADELAASFHLWAKAGEAKAITKGLLTKRVAVGTAVDGKSIMPHVTHMIRLCAQGRKRCSRLQGKRSWPSKARIQGLQERAQLAQCRPSKAQGASRCHRLSQVSKLVMLKS